MIDVLSVRTHDCHRKCLEGFRAGRSQVLAALREIGKYLQCSLGACDVLSRLGVRAYAKCSFFPFVPLHYKIFLQTRNTRTRTWVMRCKGSATRRLMGWRVFFEDSEECCNM